MVGGDRRRGAPRRAAHPTHRRPARIGHRRPHRSAVLQYTAACFLAVIALVVMIIAQRSGTAATTVMVAAAEPSTEASPDRLRPEAMEPTATEPAAPSTTAPTTTEPPPATTTTSPPPPTGPETTTTTEAPPPTLAPDEPLERTIITLHGDELLRDAERELRLALAPAAVEIDATGGLSLLAASPRIAAQHRNGLVDVVVIAIGAHDEEFPDGYEDLVAGTFDSLDHVRCVVWVTSEETTEGVSAVNSAIARQAERHENALLADWADAAVAITTRDADGGLTAQARDRFALVVGATVRECIGG
ncbi:MAG: hypothetical protein AAFZ07_06795 [Actinomycetota bacterium]